MEAFKENLPEIEIGSSVESFRRLLDSQSELFHKQINQLQSVVVTQCKLTGVNPLAQEMAAGALSIKIGKRPRDLLNPKAVKYMQAVFSIKDAISKKESREISALFGITVTQVRDFFTSQRSRVRKHVRLSREKAIRSNACKEQHDGVQTSNDPITPTDLVPLNSLPTTSDPMPPMDPVPLNSVGPLIAEEAPACSTQSDIPAGIDGLDKHFTENIFSMMRREDTFSGQVKLMDWILQMQNSSVLNWFLMKGGVMILATWLSEAAIEEQTSVLLVILKVLCHLPLHNALPEHMSAILQSVNRLRFYRISDISNRARVLLSRWSKLFARSQAMKKPNGIKSSADSHSQMLLKQSIVEIMGDESWNSSLGIPEEILTPSCESLENPRRLEQAPKLLLASADDSARKHILGASSSYTRGRRKVQLVEQPGQKTSGRSPQLVRAVPVNQGRPMSADDIQKAKMRALYMQSKYGKTGSSSNGSSEAKTEGLNKPSATQASNLSPLSKLHVRPKTEEPKKPVVLSPKLSNKLGISRDTKQNIISQEPLWERCKRVQIPWQMPPEIKLVDLWRVGAGENSKEVDIQKNRNRREKETIYLAAHEIPLNAKEPWDLEMDYDDTLTPEIPTEQPPDTEAGEAHITEPQLSQTEHVNSGVTSAAPSSSHIGGGGTAEPDFELLAVLLKNPELVFALTSGQAGNLSSEETVKLLDMIKAGSAGNLNGLGKQVEEKVEVSLPSPTPSATSGTSGWRPEAVRNPFSQLNPSGNRVANTSAGVAATIPSVEMLSATSLVQPHVPPTNITRPQQPINLPSLSQQVPPAMAPFSLPQTAIVSEKHQSFVSSLHQSLLAHSQIMQTQNPEVVSAMNSNLLVAAGPSVGMDAINDVKPSPVSNPPTAPERQPVPLQFSSLFATSILQQTQLQVQPQAQPQLQASLVPDSSVHAPLYPPRQPVGNVGPVSDSWRARQALASNPYSQANQNVYNPSYGGPVQGHPLSGPPREVNEYVGDEGFESWSPENSPTRSPEYKRGRNLSESRLTTGWDQRPDRSRQRNSPGYWDHNRLGNRRWRDRRR